jgi:hypothetical protein
MPWCPKCNAEYQEGYTECSDCGVTLVDNLEEEVELVPFFQAADKKVAEKLVSYFKYSNLPSEVSYDEENEVYVVSIAQRMEKHAKKLYQAFYYVERENLAKSLFQDQNQQETDSQTEEDNLDEAATKPDETGTEASVEEAAEDYDNQKEETEDEGAASGSYIFKADRYRDLAGTVLIFLLFGIVGLAFVLLNVIGILSFLNGWLPNTVMGALFISFLYVAISTNQKAKNIRTEIAAENKLTDEINAWLKVNITKAFLASIHNDSVSEELNYIKMTDTIKELLVGQFGKQNLSYLDRLVEEYYNNNF